MRPTSQKAGVVFETKGEVRVLTRAHVAFLNTRGLKSDCLSSAIIDIGPDVHVSDDYRSNFDELEAPVVLKSPQSTEALRALSFAIVNPAIVGLGDMVMAAEVLDSYHHNGGSLTVRDVIG